MDFVRRHQPAALQSFQEFLDRYQLNRLGLPQFQYSAPKTAKGAVRGSPDPALTPQVLQVRGQETLAQRSPVHPLPPTVLTRAKHRLSPIDPANGELVLSVSGSCRLSIASTNHESEVLRREPTRR